jgi:hypothetical protein
VKTLTLSHKKQATAHKIKLENYKKSHERLKVDSRTRRRELSVSLTFIGVRRGVTKGEEDGHRLPVTAIRPFQGWPARRA